MSDVFFLLGFFFHTGKKKGVDVNDTILSPPVTRMRRAAVVPDFQLEVGEKFVICNCLSHYIKPVTGECLLYTPM